MDKISASFPGTTVSLNYLKKLRGLRQKKYRGQARLFLAEGVRLCEEAQRSTAKINALIFNPDQVVGERMQNILQRAGLKNIPIYQASEKDFSSISETETPQGIAVIVQQPSWNLNAITGRTHSLLLGCDAIQDPGNLGTILRTAEWFGVDGVLLGKGCVDLYNAKVIRSSMGAIFHLPAFENVVLEEFLPELKKQAYRIIGTKAERGSKARYGQMAGKNIILMGNEANGLTENVAAQVDEWITISGNGKSESLNVAIATGIILYLIGTREKADE